MSPRQAAGRLGGLARAAGQTSEARSELAKLGARSLWGPSPATPGDIRPRPRREPKQIGVYRIACTPTGDSYIGASTDIQQRLYNHVRLLVRGEHHIRRLQELWNEHGPDTFAYDVLEILADPASLKVTLKSCLSTESPSLNPPGMLRRSPGTS